MLESGVAAAGSGVRGTFGWLGALPGLERDNAALRTENQQLQAENARLHDVAAQYASAAAVRPILETYSRSIEARVIGYPPEDESRSVTIDRGSNAGVHVNDGVLAAGGVVGRVESVTPLASKVVLITDYTSRLPAISRNGHYWGIARGNLSSVRVEYFPHDAPLRLGDTIVTGEGRAFHSGEVIGKIVAIERGDATLFQTAVVRPAVNLGALDRVVVVPK